MQRRRTPSRSSDAHRQFHREAPLEKVAPPRSGLLHFLRFHSLRLSKTLFLELISRDQGATLAEIAKATDWQNHSIRGFVSGHVTKKLGLKVESAKSEAGARTYR